MQTPPPLKLLGQHFLHERGVIQRIIEAIAPGPQDTIVEIGPGRGALTGPLLDSGAVLHAVEIDRRLAPRLRRRFGGRKHFFLHLEDARNFDFSGVAGDGEIRIVGNLPYNISAPLLFYFFRCGARVRDLHLMLQQEVARRLAAAPGGREYGRLTVMARFYCSSIRRLFSIHAGAFQPPPKVLSSVVEFIPRRPLPSHIQEEKLDRVLRLAFQQRRKTLRRSLEGAVEAGALAAAGIDAGLRAEQLGLEKFLRISALLHRETK